MRDLELRGLSKSFGTVRALDDCSLTVHEGEIYGFVGSNGAGKTTAMRIALGVLAADAGEVLFDGRPLDHAARARVGYIPTSPSSTASTPPPPATRCSSGRTASALADAAGMRS